VIVSEFSLDFTLSGVALFYKQSSSPFLRLNPECRNRDVTKHRNAVTKRSPTVTNHTRPQSYRTNGQRLGGGSGGKAPGEPRPLFRRKL